MNEIMEYVFLRNTDLRVSKIALGCGFRGLHSTPEASSTIDYAIEKGINLFDCANIYQLRDGDYAEKVLAKSMKGRRDKFVVTSKLGAPATLDDGSFVSGASPAVMERCLDNSLSRLASDYIDIYFLHGPDRDVPVEEIVKSFNRMIEKGKIRYYGFCNCDSSYIEEACRIASSSGLRLPSVVQGAYNLINRSAESDIFPSLDKHNLSFMAYSPLAAGFLSGNFSANIPFLEKSTWEHDEYYKRYLKYLYKGKIRDVIAYLQNLAKESGFSVPALALYWVVSNKNCSVCISGSDTPDELSENLTYENVELSLSKLNELNRLSSGLCETLTKPYVISRLKNLE